MVGGFATVAGGVMAAYVRFGVDAGHLLAASVMSAPAALVVAKIMFPETEDSPTRGEVTLQVPQRVRQRARRRRRRRGRGPEAGRQRRRHAAGLHRPGGHGQLRPGLRWGCRCSRSSAGSSRRSPGSWACPGPRPPAFGNLLGTKIAVNEFVGYIELVDAPATAAPSRRAAWSSPPTPCAASPTSAASPSRSAASAPSRPSGAATWPRLGLKAMFGGALASWLTATIAGVLIGG